MPIIYEAIRMDFNQRDMRVTLTRINSQNFFFPEAYYLTFILVIFYKYLFSFKQNPFEFILVVRLEQLTVLSTMNSLKLRSS